MVAYSRRQKRCNKIQTPLHVSQFIYDLLVDKFEFGQRVIDPACGEGNLLRPWNEFFFCYGVDIDQPREVVGRFRRADFLTSKVCSFKSDLILCNPPFSGSTSNLAFAFFRRIQELWEGVPLVFIAPMTFRLNNNNLDSTRYAWLRDHGPQIKSIIALPRDIFPGVSVHTEILIYNIDGLEPHYYMPSFNPSVPEFWDRVRAWGFWDKQGWTKEGGKWLSENRIKLDV